jgi:hypothetical protein
MDDTRSPGLLRRLRRAAILSALLASAATAAETPPDTASTPLSAAGPLATLAPMPPPPPDAASSAAASAPVGRRHDILGLQLDVGVPDIGGVSLLYRPLKWMRFEGGMLYSYAGYGVRGGVSVLPYFPIAPSLTLEAGHYFDANYAMLSKYVTVKDDLQPLLEKVGYTFVNAQVGLELGHPNAFVFFVRAGVSKVWMSVHNAKAAVKASQSSSPGDTQFTDIADPNVRFGIPNVKLGFMIYFW